MVDTATRQTIKQKMFDDIVSGILLYSVVLAFFSDYTSLLYTKSYSVTFAVAVVMEILTYLTFAIKDRIVSYFRGRGDRYQKLRMGLGVWLVMFLSKFVFLGAISVIFRGEVQVSGFLGLIVIIVCMTIAQKLIQLAYNALGR